MIHHSPWGNCDVLIEVLIRFSAPPGEGEEPIFGNLRGKDTEKVLWVRKAKANGEVGDERSKRIFDGYIFGSYAFIACHALDH